MEPMGSPQRNKPYETLIPGAKKLQSVHVGDGTN